MTFQIHQQRSNCPIREKISKPCDSWTSVHISCPSNITHTLPQRFRSVHIWEWRVPVVRHQWWTKEVAETESQWQHRATHWSHYRDRWLQWLIDWLIPVLILWVHRARFKGVNCKALCPTWLSYMYDYNLASAVESASLRRRSLFIFSHSQATTWVWISIRCPHRLRHDSRVPHYPRHPPTARFCKWWQQHW